MPCRGHDQGPGCQPQAGDVAVTSDARVLRMQSVRPMRSHGPLSRLWVVASAIWILFWAWRFASGCDVLADTLACLGVNVEGTVPPKGSSLERLARLVALMFGAPLVA